VDSKEFGDRNWDLRTLSEVQLLSLSQEGKIGEDGRDMSDPFGKKIGLELDEKSPELEGYYVGSSYALGSFPFMPC
jgi:hypothetical protein